MGAAAKPPTALAGTVSNGIWWNWNQEIGAVASPQADDTATPVRRPDGSGKPSSQFLKCGASRKIAKTAANESWKPGSSALYGLHASRAIAATTSA
jgi:hypothetical protein